MKERIQRRTELLIKNREILNKEFLLENRLLTMVAGAAFAGKDKTADPELVKESRDILRKKKGAFSEVRGNNELVISTKMALSGNPEQYLDDLLMVYEKLQGGKLFGSSYRVIAAATICDSRRANDAERIVEKTEAIIKGMKASHPFLTSDEDTGFVVLLAMTDKSVEQILTELEESYQFLKRDFLFHDNAVYSLAQVLTTKDGDGKEKCKKAIDLFEAFKDAGFQYGKDEELPSLGVLVDPEKETGEIVAEVIEVAQSLKGPGFGMFDMSKQTKLMLGAMIVSGAYGDDSSTADASIASGTLSMVITQQIVLLAIVIASTASVTSSSSH